MRPSIGIAITTYNRREQLLRLVHSLRQHCRDQVHLAVFDDGSGDGTGAAVAPLVDAVLEAPNGGIPTNKNRALFYFLALQPVDQLILLGFGFGSGMGDLDGAGAAGCGRSYRHGR